MRFLLTAVFLSAATPSIALDLELTGFYNLNQPASLEYDPDFCGLWIANEGPEVILVTLQGDELRRFRSDLYRIKAVTIDKDELLVADGAGNFQRLDKSGERLAPPFQVEGGWADTEGIVIDEDGLIISVEDDPERLSWIEPDGTIVNSINTRNFEPPLIEPQGIARDPRTGHLLIVDDRDGTNSLYEVTADGVLLAIAPLRRFGRDPEGIAIRPGSDELFIAFEQGARIASFAYAPTLSEDAEDLPVAADCALF